MEVGCWGHDSGHRDFSQVICLLHRMFARERTMIATLQPQRGRRGWVRGMLLMLHITVQRYHSGSITPWLCTPRRARPQAILPSNQCVGVRVRTFVSSGDRRDSGVVSVSIIETTTLWALSVLRTTVNHQLKIDSLESRSSSSTLFCHSWSNLNYFPDAKCIYTVSQITLTYTTHITTSTTQW